MVTSLYDWKILVWDEKPKASKQTHKKTPNERTNERTNKQTEQTNKQIYAESNILDLDVYRFTKIQPVIWNVLNFFDCLAWLVFFFLNSWP